MKRLMVMLVASCMLALATGVGAAYAGLPEVPGGQSAPVGSVSSAGSGQQSQSASQQASNEATNEQLSGVALAENKQIGGNNNTVQVGGLGGTREAAVPVDGNGGNESNGNTNSAGDQTAVNGNNFQQSNEQGISQAQTSGSSPARDGGGPAENGGGPAVTSAGSGCNSGCGGTHEDGNSGSSGGQSQTAKQSGENEASNKQGTIVIGGSNTQIGLNNNTIQAGSGNESNGNTNTAGDQTAVNGNNFQQSNEQGTSQSQASSGSSSGKTNEKSCGCKPKDGKTSGGQSQTAKQSGENEAWNKQGSIVIGAHNTQIGGNNNTIQLGSGNESNGNTNSSGDQTAVNGNNFQQSNEQGISQSQSQRSGSPAFGKEQNGCQSRCGPPKHECGCEKQHGDGQSQSARQSGENEAWSKQGSIVIGAHNTQIGGNNNTIQLGSGNESNGNTNTAGDQTAVNGNNFQQSNEQGISQSQRSAGSDSGKDGCHSGCGPPKREPCGCEKPKTSDHGSCGCEQPKQPKHECGCEKREQPKHECGCEKREQPKHECGCEKREQPKHECGCEKQRGDGQSQSAYQSAENEAYNKQFSFVLGAANTQIGGNNNTIQGGGLIRADSVVDGQGNQSNHNTNTAGDQTAVNGNNFQQTNNQGVSQKQKSGSGRPRVIPV
jgi:hypothetical protein